MPFFSFFRKKTPAEARQAEHRKKLKDFERQQQTATQHTFLVLGAPRTGSQLLMTCLNSVENLKTFSEILGKDEIGLPPNANKAEALEHIRRSLHFLNTPIAGAKLFFWQMKRYGLSYRDLERSFPNTKFIILYRANLFEQYVSLQLAVKTGQWSRAAYNAKLKIAPQAVLRFCRQTRAEYRTALADKWLKNRTLLLNYNELAADPNLCFRNRILPFLDLPPQDVYSRMNKQNTREVAEAVENFSEIEPLLSRWETKLTLDFIDEPVNLYFYCDQKNLQPFVRQVFSELLNAFGYNAPPTLSAKKLIFLFENPAAPPPKANVVWISETPPKPNANAFWLSPAHLQTFPYESVADALRFFDLLNEEAPFSLKDNLRLTLWRFCLSAEKKLKIKLFFKPNSLLVPLSWVLAAVSRQKKV